MKTKTHRVKKKKEKNRKGFFKDNYIKCWKFLKEVRYYVYCSILLFLVFAVIGFVFPVFFREQIADFIKSLVFSIENYNTFQLIVYIFFNNLKAAFLAIIFGLFFGIVPALNAIVNGYLLGFVSREAVNNTGVATLWKLIPHGIFELPAIFLSIGIGFKLGVDIFSSNLKEDFIESMRFFIFVIFPLLLIAAVIEGTLFIILK